MLLLFLSYTQQTASQMLQKEMPSLICTAETGIDWKIRSGEVLLQQSILYLDRIPSNKLFQATDLPSPRLIH